jgi:hypothetical protein
VPLETLDTEPLFTDSSNSVHAFDHFFDSRFTDNSAVDSVSHTSDKALSMDHPDPASASQPVGITYRPTSVGPPPYEEIDS